MTMLVVFLLFFGAVAYGDRKVGGPLAKLYVIRYPKERPWLTSSDE